MHSLWYFSSDQTLPEGIEFRASLHDARVIMRALNTHYSRDTVTFGDADIGPQFLGEADSALAHSFISEEME